MKKLLVICLLIITSNSLLKAEVDFVGLLVSDIKAGENSEKEGYKCITVSPSMMEKMLDMMPSNDAQESAQIRKVLPHIKSLRIFNSQEEEAEEYGKEAITLLDKNKDKYKPYNASKKETKSKIWLRKNKDKVVEIVMLIQNENDFKIVNFTGSMTTEFVTELLKM